MLRSPRWVREHLFELAEIHAQSLAALRLWPYKGIFISWCFKMLTQIVFRIQLQGACIGETVLILVLLVWAKTAHWVVSLFLLDVICVIEEQRRVLRSYGLVFEWCSLSVLATKFGWGGLPCQAKLALSSWWLDLIKMGLSKVQIHSWELTLSCHSRFLIRKTFVEAIEHFSLGVD